MAEDFEKNTRAINVEQATAAQRAQFEAAAEAVFQVQMTDAAERTLQHYSVIQSHKDTLLRFAEELMDDHFKGEVANLIKKCNEILDEPLKSIL